ncbi:MAG TPA: hypothetical protein PL183_12475, partial [Aquamicrobium sp.]|nr:hypothetical protein [Aquamicrobium sp.]
AAASILPSFKGESRKPTSGSAVSLTPSKRAWWTRTKERMVSLKALRDQAAADAERTQLALDSSGNQGVTPDMLKGFARKARERIRLNDGGYRRDHLRALAQRVEVADDEVRIMGSKSKLLRTLAAA